MPSSAPRRLVVVLGYSDGRNGGLHPICAARLGHAAGLARDGDAVLLSGWARRPGAVPEAELMRAAWRGPAGTLVCDPDSRVTAENAAHAAAHARELAVAEVLVVTSSWHRPRAALLFRALLRGVRVTVEAAPAPLSARVLLRELAAFPLAPVQLALARRRAAALSARRGSDAAA